MTGLKQLLLSSRPISWVNTAFPFAAAYYVVTERIDLPLIVGLLFFLIPYNLLMYGINDVFDYESDLRNPRKGGIEGALLDPKYHRLTLTSSVLVSVPFIGYLVFTGSLQSSLWLAAVLFTVVAYSVAGLRFKEKPLLDSLTSAAHFAGPMIFGLSYAGVDAFAGGLPLVILAFFLWGAASHAFGAVQDIRADRAAGIASIATAFGAKNTVRFAFASYLLAAIVLVGLGWPGNLTAIAAVPYLAIISPYLNVSDAECEKTNRGWRRFIWLNFFAGAVVSLVLITYLRAS